jgi:cyclopropane fatty-acyl-phospholipid synthase-like methyltransferase
LLGRVPGDLPKVITYYIKPYIANDTVALEIGSGGGRWTQYMLQARELILVDLNAQFFPYLKQRFEQVESKLRFYQTKGYELDGIEADCVDFIFSFGTFVHIDPEGIDLYFDQIKRVMKPGAIGVIHYADRSKKFFRDKEPGYLGFSDMNAGKMEGLLSKHSLNLREHNVTLLNHSNIVVFQK